MKSRSKGRGANALTCFSIAVIMVILVNTAFMRFLHYDSQYRHLDPEHYNVVVITEEDHNKLSNPENRTVMLSNGTTLTKGDVWDSLVLKKYKSINNGSQYVLVTLRGTAAFMDRWYDGIILIFCMCFVGLFLGLKRKRGEEPQKTEK
jgi:preprotein translocase subunit SecG